MAEACPRCGARCGGWSTPDGCPTCAAEATLETVLDESAPLRDTLAAVTHDGSDAGELPVGSPREEWLPDHLLFDEYAVCQKLGEGGMGAVYLVESRISGQRHAVKRTRCVDPEAREALLSEMATWRDLPDHPNLASCHFFRTLGDDVVIFAEYVDGGSLDVALRDRSSSWSTRERCDIALQFAFGLEAAHGAGYVHQDVKPGNVLLTSDGVAKVTDFGLARTQQLLASGRGPAGLTPAYCSPEQAFRDQPITAATDIWSWAVSVFELFVGDIKWQTGIFAPGVFELYRSGRLPDCADTMPAGLADILELCFKNEVDERWQSSTALCNALSSFWREEFGEDNRWSRSRLPATDRKRSHRSSRRQLDPRVWLDEDSPAPEDLGEAGRLALFEKAARKLRDSVTDGEAGREELAFLLIEKGQAHHEAYDWPGALDAFDQAARITEEPILLAEIAGGRGLVLKELRRFDEAETELRRAIELLADVSGERDRRTEFRLALAETRWDGRLDDVHEALASVEVEVEGRDDLFADEITAGALVLRANLMIAEGRRSETIEIYEGAIRRYEQLILLEGRNDLRPRLGSAYFNLATGFIFENRTEESLDLFERAVRLLDNVVSMPNGRRWARELGLAKTNMSVLMRRMGELDRAEELARSAVAIFERAVHLEGRRDIEDRLTSAYLNLSTILSHRNDFAEALLLAQRVVDIRRRLVEDEGREDFRGRLAAILGNKGFFLAELDRTEEASAAYRESIDLREAMLADGDLSVRPGLARQYVNRAGLHVLRGVWEEALSDTRRAAEFLAEAESKSVLDVELGLEMEMALWELDRRDEARERHESTGRLLEELVADGVPERQIANERVRHLAQGVVFGPKGSAETRFSAAIDAITSEPEAMPTRVVQALLRLGHWAVGHANDELRIVIDAIDRLIDDELSDDALPLSVTLELDYLRARATGETLRSDAIERIRQEAARTGRVSLRRIARRYKVV